MNRKGIAILVTIVMMLAMIPVVAFATVETITPTAPADPVYLRSSTAETVPVTFTIDVSDDTNVAARISLMDGNDEISYATRTIHPDDGSWSGTVNLPVKAGTPEGVYDIKIVLTQGTDIEDAILEGMVRVDNTAPTSTITDPDNMQELSTGAAVEITGEASDADITGTSIDGSGIAGVALQITGPSHYSRTLTVNGKEDWSADWDTPSTAGAYVVSARATDEAGNVQATATAITVYVGMEAPDTYTLTMAATTGGTASAITAGPYISGSAVSISATANNGYEFTGWTASAGKFADDQDPTTTFTMPDKNATVTAHFELKSSEDGDDTDEDTVAFKAAPAIAAEILKYNNIAPNAKKEKGAKGEKGMNYISAVAKEMGNGGDFSKGDKSDYDDYYDAVLEYLTDLTDVSLKDPRE